MGSFCVTHESRMERWIGVVHYKREWAKPAQISATKYLLMWGVWIYGSMQTIMAAPSLRSHGSGYTDGIDHRSAT